MQRTRNLYPGRNYRRRKRGSVTRRAFLIGGAAAAGTAVVVSPPSRSVFAGVGWFLMNDQPPDVLLTLPDKVVNGDVTVGVQVGGSPSWQFVEARVDDKMLTPGPQINIDTKQLPDGDHRFRVAVRDNSLHRNVRWTEGILRTDNTPPTIVMESHAPAGVQGRTTVLQVKSDKPAEMQLDLGLGTPLPFWQVGTDYVAVIGLDPMVKTGPRPAKVLARDMVGNEAAVATNFDVEPGNFSREEIDLPADKLKMLTSGDYDEELKRLMPFYQNVDTPKLWDGMFEAPVKAYITSGYGIFRTYNGGQAKNTHLGIDFGVPSGTPVHATAKGKVRFAELTEVRGNVVILDHGLGVHSAYYHMSRLDVKAGDVVNKQQQIGLSGNLGISTGPHLHLEVRIAGAAVDATEWLHKKFL